MTEIEKLFFAGFPLKKIVAEIGNIYGLECADHSVGFYVLAS